MLAKARNSKGFTIVELLIVIVVIAILATITIVAYNGIQNRAHTTAQKTAAENLAKKVEAYNAINSAYPKYDTAGNITTALNGTTDSSLSGSGITIGTPAAGTADGIVQLRLCTTASPTAGTTVPTGYAVYIWDSTLSTPALSPVQAGGAATISGGSVTCASPSTTVTTVS